MHEFLNPSALQMVVSNVLHAAYASSHDHSYSSGPRQGKSFLGQPWEPQLSAGKDGTTDPEKTCRYCKDMVYDLNNCLHLQCKKDFQACQQSGGWSN